MPDNSDSSADRANEMNGVVAAKKEEHQQRLKDSRLVSVRDLIASEPEDVAAVLSETAIILLRPRKAFVNKRNGVRILEDDDDLYPREIKWNSPEFLVDKALVEAGDEETLKNKSKFDELARGVQESKKAMKKTIIDQAHHEVNCLKAKLLASFMEQSSKIATSMITTCYWTQALADLAVPASTLGAAACHCYYSELSEDHELFSFLGRTKTAMLRDLTTANDLQFNLFWAHVRRIYRSDQPAKPDKELLSVVRPVKKKLVKLVGPISYELAAKSEIDGDQKRAASSKTQTWQNQPCSQRGRSSWRQEQSTPQPGFRPFVRAASAPTAAAAGAPTTCLLWLPQ